MKLLSKSRTKRLIYITIVLVLITLSYQHQVNQALSKYSPNHSNVVEAIDGDTIVVRFGGKNETVRLIGVDTPELHHPKKPVQCFGAEAKDFTSAQIGDQSVRLVADPEDGNRDIYGRLLRYVYLPNGELLNQELVAKGFGFAYTIFPFTHKSEMVLAEKTARTQHFGLWSHCQVHQDSGVEQTNPI